MFKGPYLGGPAPLVTSQNPLGSPPPRFSRLPEESADSLSQKLHLLGGTSAKHLHGSAWCFESWAAEFGWNLGICRQLSTYLSPWLLRKLTPGNVWLLVLKLGRKKRWVEHVNAPFEVLYWKVRIQQLDDPRWPSLHWPFAIFRVGWQAHAQKNQGELCLPSPGFIHVPQLQKVSQVGHSLANTLRLTFGLAEEIVVGHVKYNILGWSKTTALFKKDLRCWTLEIEGYPMVRQPLN